VSSFLDGQLWIYVLVGVVFGYVVGAVPGFGGGNILAILVPFTLQWQPTYTIVFFSAVYATTELGGSWPGIILNVPGSPASAAASVDGYQMARKGAGDRALGLYIMSVFLGMIVC
jgi:putative tricarboxylic transport membrane protein